MKEGFDISIKDNFFEKELFNELHMKLNLIIQDIKNIPGLPVQLEKT